MPGAASRWNWQWNPSKQEGPLNPASLWRPLRVPIFRNPLAADVISDLGTFMQSVGAAWLIVSLNAGPMYVHQLCWWRKHSGLGRI
jgi:hypothetical protein